MRTGLVIDEQHDLVLRALEDHKIENLPEPLLLYRRHSDNVTIKHAYQMTLAVTVAHQATRLRRAGKSDPTDRLETLLDESILGTLEFEERDFFELRLNLLHALIGLPKGTNREDLEKMRSLLDHLMTGRVEKKCLDRMHSLRIRSVARLLRNERKFMDLHYFWGGFKRHPASFLKIIVKLFLQKLKYHLGIPISMA